MAKILVTGGSRGIGLATVKALLAEGHQVVATYASAAGELNKIDCEDLHVLHADLSAPNTAAILFDQAVATLGAVDGLVNNAGVMPLGDVSIRDDIWDDVWQQCWQVNVKAVADLCRLFLRQDMQSARRIVSIGSRAAVRGDSPDAMHYAASKGAVHALMKSIARGWGDRNVFAFTIAPGWTRTDMASVAYEPGNEHMLHEIPIGRAAEPDEIAATVAFFLSGKADSATGSVFDINGASHVR